MYYCNTFLKAKRFRITFSNVLLFLVDIEVRENEEYYLRSPYGL